MPLKIVRDDIVKVNADAIVNTSSPSPVIGRGVDLRINNAAGPELIRYREKFGQLEYGDAVMTPSGKLGAKAVIHAVTPVWRGGGFGERHILADCYRKALAIAEDAGMNSIAFPLLSAGNQGFPNYIALETANSVFEEFLADSEMLICLVLFSDEAMNASGELRDRIEEYIDSNMADEIMMEESACCWVSDIPVEYNRNEKKRSFLCLKRKKAKLEDIDSMLEGSFTEELIRLAGIKNMTDPQVYKAANIDRKAYNKIINAKDYHPGKNTAIALGFALRLNLDQMKDFIGRAGYALTRASRFDIIIEFCILNDIYNIIRVNEILFEYTERTLN